MPMKLTDKIILFLCCSAAYLCEPEFGRSVVPLILSIIFTSFLGFFEKEPILTVLMAGFLVWSIFLPGLVLFIPLIFYDALFTRNQYVCLVSLVPFISFFRTQPLEADVFAAILVIFSLWLRYRTNALENLKTERNELRDTSKEMSLKLEKQNQDLLEQQDSEINIATLNERNRIAREIHDSVGHLLSSSLLQVGALLAVNKDENTRGNLVALKETLTNAMNSIRSSVHDLYDESIDLYAQVYKLSRDFTFCRLDFNYELTSEPEKKLKYAFISIVKESLANIIRHSNATQAKIVFHEHPALYQLIISDNGKVEDYDPESGIGLKNIRERVDSFHGIMNITTENGFKIFISIPKGETRE
ncbi:MAG TPA: histidine kinase [Caproicibacter sp.]|nr:histidine kinase [Caproicibacter sp.]